MKKILNLFNWKPEGQEDLNTNFNSNGEFNLFFDKILIGTLKFEKGMWTFSYSPEFQTSKINAIIDFPDKNKNYQSEQLCPFFATRIPTLNQPYQFKKIEKAKAQKNDEVALLKIFGRSTITNPFQLLSI